MTLATFHEYRPFDKRAYDQIAQEVLPTMLEAGATWFRVTYFNDDFPNPPYPHGWYFEGWPERPQDQGEFAFPLELAIDGNAA